MPEYHRECIEPALTKIESHYRVRIQDLMECFYGIKRVLDIGCDGRGGHEAIALMWWLEAIEVVGVDKDISKIEYNACQLAHDLDYFRDALKYKHVKQDERDWWLRVPLFLRNGQFPTFIQKDITVRADFLTKLGEEPFNLAYCSNVLYIVHEDHGSSGLINAFENIFSALVPGSWFIAHEPKPVLECLKTDLTTLGIKVWIKGNPNKPTYWCKRVE